MALPELIVAVDAPQHLASRWMPFLVGTVCGVGVTLIAGSYRNSRIAETPTIERNDMPTQTTSLCTNTAEESMKAPSETTREEGLSEGDRGLSPPGDEKAGPLVQVSSQTPPESDVQAPNVQLGDFHGLENHMYTPGPDYLYLPKPEVSGRRRQENNEKESDLMKHTCWCITTWGSKLEPLLQAVHKHFNDLEDIRYPRWYFDLDLEVADQEIRESGNALNEIAFRYAIRQGYSEFVSRYVKYPHSVEWGSLKLAITSDQIDVARVIFAEAKLSGYLKHRGLEEAAHQGRLNLMDLFMVDFGVDVNGSDETNPLKAAAAAGQVEAVKKLIRAGAMLEAWGKKSMVEEPNQSPLVAAVARDRFEVVEELISAGARFKDEPCPAHVPLNVAIKAGHARIVALLLQHGADPHSFKSAYTWKDILKLAVTKGHLKLARMALKQRVNINMAVHVFGTLLKQAVIQEDEKMVTLLISRGAEINHLGHTGGLGGNCALLASAACRNKNIFLLLLRHGASIEKANGPFGDLMQTVAHLGYADMVQVVLEQKPDIDVDYRGDSRLQSPLYMAISHYLRVWGGIAKAVEGVDHMEVMRLLLNHGAKLPHQYRGLRRKIEESK